MESPLIRLQCGCNSYQWGKRGTSSAAAKLASATGFQVQDDKPYAELWMGTHPSLPSKDVASHKSLLDLVRGDHALMTPQVAKRYGNKLPFLFKVLSINTALSIQAHPNKKLAEQLHARDPKNYPDDNHKPEMTIALTPFSGFCGFRPLVEIAHFLTTVPELRALVGETTAKDFLSTVKGNESSSDQAQIRSNKAALQKAFTSLMKTSTTSPSTLKSASEALVASAKDALKSGGNSFAGDGGLSPNSGEQLAKLVVTLNSQFPNDVGLFVLFFLNYIQLAPGEALFLKADDIHAYISGDIVECMASSDNVVRAGFTPKFKDVDTLASMLTYSYAPIDEQKMDPTDYAFVKFNVSAYTKDSKAVVYDPPIEEFAVVIVEAKGKGGKATFDPLNGPSIIICTAGEGTIQVEFETQPMKEGYIFFVGAGAECILENKGDENFVTFRAFCELDKDTPVANGKM